MYKKKKNGITVLGRTLTTKRQSDKRYYTIRELITLTGLSRRQIDYWAGLKLITPSLRNPRVRGGKPASFYSAQEALKILVFSDVKSRGFSLLQIRQLQRNFITNGVELDEVGTYLLTDGVTIFYAKNDNEVIDILKSNRQMLLVPIQDQMERLKRVA